MQGCKFLVLIALCFSFCKCQPQQHPSATESKQVSVYTFGNASADGTGKFYFDREIAQVMGASGAGWLERKSRQQEENTLLAIDSMQLTPAMQVADIGAGSGYYTFKIASNIPGGKVYAVDVQDQMLQLLQDRRQREKAENVVIVKGGDSTTNLPPGSIDLAIMVDVYHELQYPHEILQSVRQALTDSGRLLLIEYRGEDAAVAIKPLHKTTVAQLNKEMAANGLSLVYEGTFLPIQHFLMYGKTKEQNR